MEQIPGSKVWCRQSSGLRAGMETAFGQCTEYRKGAPLTCAGLGWPVGTLPLRLPTRLIPCGAGWGGWSANGGRLQNNDECRKYSKGRFMFFTAWRSIDFEDPVQDYTLTVRMALRADVSGETVGQGGGSPPHALRRFAAAVLHVRALSGERAVM